MIKQCAFLLSALSTLYMTCEPPNPIGVVPVLKSSACSKQLSTPASFKQLGDHILAEFTGCSQLNASDELEDVLRQAAKAAGATVLSVTVHRFEPFGMTGVAVLQESHISVHTWPEHGYTSIDIYTCGEHVCIEKALDVLRNFFTPKAEQVVSVQRGFDTTESYPSEVPEQFRTA